MSGQQNQFQSINTSQGRESPRPSSRPRSLISRLSTPSLYRAHTGQSFDDHAVYVRSNSASEAPPAEPASTSDVDLEKKNKDENDLYGSDEHSTHSYDREDIERGADEVPPADLKAKTSDQYLVTWFKDDPENPKNWSMGRKWAATFIISMFTLISPVSSSMVAPALTTMDRELGIHTEFESAMVLSIFVLAYAVGPLFLGPLSEIYGRVIILQVSNLWYLVFNLAGGFAQTSSQMLAFRFLSGLGGSAPLAIGGAVLGDCFHPEQRGKAVSIYSLAPLLGPAIGMRVRVLQAVQF